MNIEQLNYYSAKLSYEMDSADLFDALKSGEDVVIVDGRSAAAFKLEHIPDAVNLPHREICSNTTANLDRDKTYVCYCDGIGCNASTKTALKLLTLGFKVKELIGGLDWWKRDGYETQGEKAQSGTGVVCGC
ncbi:MAG TPA: rhodanese-like domain-containing protein [Nitratifractor sp.]|jgi:rhodanese-related sulfurtransferase|nr:rhodanese-like domain-containing protein [Nitratifractor sp.]